MKIRELTAVTLGRKVKYVMFVGRLSVSGTLIGFLDELEKVIPIRFERRKEEREID